MLNPFKVPVRGWGRVLELVGLGGWRLKYTAGDLWWCVGLAWASGFLVGAALVAVLTR